MWDRMLGRYMCSSWFKYLNRPEVKEMLFVLLLVLSVIDITWLHITTIIKEVYWIEKTETNLK